MQYLVRYLHRPDLREMAPGKPAWTNVLAKPIDRSGLLRRCPDVDGATTPREPCNPGGDEIGIGRGRDDRVRSGPLRAFVAFISRDESR
jgi:hypothetical protein